MSMFGKLADRLLNTVAPTAEVDAACIYLRTVKTVNGICWPGYTPRIKSVTSYDNCPQRVEYSC